MLLTNVLRRVLRRSTSPRRRYAYRNPARQGRAKQARLELESLEYRLVPAGQVLFYNAPDGVVVTGSVDAAGTFTQQQAYGFSDWTHIVGVGGGEVLFYNSPDSVAVTGNVDAAGTFTQQQAYGFSAWTHIVGVDPFGGVGGGGGAGQPSGPEHLPAILDPWSGPFVLSDEGVLSYQDARHTPAPEVASSGRAEALLGGPQFQKAWGEEFQLRIQHSHASTPQQGFLDESALAVWFSLADDHTRR